MPGDHRGLLEQKSTFELIHGFLQDVSSAPLPGFVPLEDDCSMKQQNVTLQESSRKFYASYKYWEYCMLPDEPEVRDGWVIV